MLRLYVLCCVAIGLALADGSGALFPDMDGRYYVYDFAVNWFKAMEMCFDFGQRPATFTTEAEYLNLTALIRKSNRYNLRSSFWVGGSDLGQTGTFMWLPTGKPFLFTRWYEGAPDNYKCGHDEVEHCVELQAAHDYMMNDNACSKSNYIVCENKP